MALHANTAYPLALGMALSDGRDFFASRSFASFKSHLEARQKFNLALLGRFDSIVRGMGGLAKMLRALGRR